MWACSEARVTSVQTLGSSVITLAARAPQNTVYLGSFSKVLAPGLRLGYVAAPKALFPKLLQAKQAADLHTPIFNQRVVHEVIRQGLLEGIWCLDPREGLSPGQSAEIDRVVRQYPELVDDEFVVEHEADEEIRAALLCTADASKVRDYEARLAGAGAGHHRVRGVEERRPRRHLRERFGREEALDAAHGHEHAADGSELKSGGATGSASPAADDRGHEADEQQELEHLRRPPPARA